ncbi:MAG: glycosyltransferase family 4 protein [Dehalococcoidia bacterium]|nr:glycosyltransferase family 4 protein [Dehalococcoidia bacterium]
MRILLFNWRDIANPQAGGAEVHMHEVFTRIARLGHRVTLVCCGFPGARSREALDGLDVIRLGNWMTYPFLAFAFYKIKASKEGFDAVVEDISKTPLFTPLYVRQPILAIWHMRHGAVLFKLAPAPLAMVIYALESLMPRVYRHIPFAVVSPSTRDVLISQGVDPQKVEIIYNGVDPGNLRPGTRSGIPLLVYVGRVVRYKQLDHLVKAFTLIKQRVPSARLLIAGKGNDHRRLKRLATTLGLDGTVAVEGALNEDRKRSILQQAWLYAIPSMCEGWGISVIEANACGTPAIGYDIAGLRDSISHRRTGILVPAGDIEALADASVNVLGDDALRASLGSRALEHAALFSWDASAAAFLRLLERVTSQRGAPQE